MKMKVRFSLISILTFLLAIVASLCADAQESDSVGLTDLQIKGGTEPDFAYAIDNLYMETPEGYQVRMQAVDPQSRTAAFQVKVENDGPSARSFSVQATEGDRQDAWRVAYKVGSQDITDQILSPQGYTTPSLVPRAYEIITIEMTASPRTPADACMESIITVTLDETDPIVRDAVEAIACLEMPSPQSEMISLPPPRRRGRLEIAPIS